MNTDAIESMVRGRVEPHEQFTGCSSCFCGPQRVNTERQSDGLPAGK